MRFQQIFRHARALCVLAILPGLRAAATDDAKAALAAGTDEVAAALTASGQGDLIERLGPLVEKHFAFATTTRLAVGPAWREFTSEQQKRATELFSRLVIRTYADRATGEVRPQIVYGAPIELKNGRVEVPTTTTAKGQTYSVAYRLEPDRNAGAAARWRVYDVVAEGVSLISNYRSQFDPIVKKDGAAGLIKTLEAKLAEAAAAAAAPR